MKNAFLFLFILLICPVQAQDSLERDSLRNMLIITCHPDDWELSMAGTAYMLKDKYNIHVIIASDGERGNSKEPDPEIAALRVGHSMHSAEKIHAQNHFFKMMDGEIYADEDAVSKTVKLLEDLDPELILNHFLAYLIKKLSCHIPESLVVTWLVIPFFVFLVDKAYFGLIIFS